MSLIPKNGILNKLFWPFRPQSNREAGSAVVSNFLLHWFPNRVTLKSLAPMYSMYLGTISFTLFMILTITGVYLMFFYTPSIERAYWSIKDIEFAVSFGWFLRRLHRISAHLMVAVVFLHMFRVFFTGSYKDGKYARSNRSFNWVIGVALLVLTLLLSFTGYLLPWDQLAFWAITVGTGLASSIPIIGENIRQFILGGTIIGQNTLIRFYVLHVFFLPVILFGFALWHMWRIRKDNGLAIVEQIREESRDKAPAVPVKTKTYTVLGIAEGTTVQVKDPTPINNENSVPSTPYLTTRLLIVVLLTLVIAAALSIFIAAPLEEAANPEVTPNPAKAPWYFLGLQEMVGYSAFMGGVLIPGIVVIGLAFIPFIDRKQENIGLWFSNTKGIRWGIIGFMWGAITTGLSIFIGVMFPMRELFPGIESRLFFEIVNPASLLLLLFVALFFISLRITKCVRTASIATFCAFVVAFILLTYVGTALRGPNWVFYLPWEVWPIHPTTF